MYVEAYFSLCWQHITGYERYHVEPAEAGKFTIVLYYVFSSTFLSI